ncbi:MAG: hypothetical protein AAFW98_10410 [Pseudomonadota bacterium]
MSTTFAIFFIIGKAAIWLLIPLAFGIWEWRRHSRMMKNGETSTEAIPAWLRADRPRRTVPAAPTPPAPSVTPAPRPAQPVFAQAPPEEPAVPTTQTAPAGAAADRKAA